MPAPEGTLAVLDYAGVSWSTATSQVPHFIVKTAIGTAATQEIAPATAEGATAWNFPGERFTPAATLTPTTLKLFLASVGMPTTSADVTLRLLDATKQQIWSGVVVPAAAGWLSTAISGVTLAGGSTYYLVVDSGEIDTANYWSLGTSGDATASFDGTTSSLVRARDRKGQSYKSAEAEDAVFADRDFIAFNGGSGDALYIGDYAKFDYVAATRDFTDQGFTASVAWSYWNGSSWAALTTTHDDFATAQPSGYTSFVPPTDWAQTKVFNSDGYFVKASWVSGGPLDLAAVSGAKELGYPATSAKIGVNMPLLYRDARTNLLYAEVQPTQLRHVEATLANNYADIGGHGTYTAPDSWSQPYEALPVVINIDVLANAGVPVNSSQMRIGETIRFFAKMQTIRGGTQPADKQLQVHTATCKVGGVLDPLFNGGTVVSENNVVTLNPEPTTTTRFLYTPSVVGRHVCTLIARSNTVGIRPIVDGGLDAVKDVTRLIGDVASNNSDQANPTEGAVKQTSTSVWTQVASLAWTPNPVPEGEIQLAGDLELSACVNDVADPSPGCGYADKTNLEVGGNLRLRVVNQNGNSCGISTIDTRPFNIQKDVHHKKFATNLTFTNAAASACGSNLTIILEVQATSGDKDGVNVEGGENSGVLFPPPQFSILYRWVKSLVA